MKGNQPAHQMLTLRYTKGIRDTVPGPLQPLFHTKAYPRDRLSERSFMALPTQAVAFHRHCTDHRCQSAPLWRNRLRQWLSTDTARTTGVRALPYGATNSGNGFPQTLHWPQEISVFAHVYNLKNKKPPYWATTNNLIFWSLQHLWDSWQKRAGEQGNWDRSVTFRQSQAHCFYFSSFSNSLR